MAVPVTTSLIPWAYEPTLAKMVEDAATHPDVADQIVGTESYTMSPDLRQFTTAGLVGLGPFAQGGETTPVTYDTPGPAGSKTTAYLEYDLAVRFTRAAIADQVTQVFNKAGEGMGRGYRLLRNILAANRLLANANATTYFTGPDGKALLATDHLSYGGGGSRANMLATSASMSYQAVTDLITVGLRQKDERGYPEPAWGVGETINVVHQPENWADATAIFNPASVQEPGNDHNTPNVLTKNFTWNPISNPYLDSTSDVGRPWFLMPAGRKQIYFVDREPLETGSHRDPIKGWVDFFGRARFCLHVEDWKGIYGSGF